MPVFDTGRYRNDRSVDKADRLFSFLLIPALAVNADEQLSAAALRVVDVPVYGSPAQR